jgi:quaternary ammonium compound-resistance protein SugE
MVWLVVLAAGLFETGFAVLLKLSHAMTRLWPTGEAVSTVKLVSIGLVLAGVIGLNLSGVTP